MMLCSGPRQDRHDMTHYCDVEQLPALLGHTDLLSLNGPGGAAIAHTHTHTHTHTPEMSRPTPQIFLHGLVCFPVTEVVC